VGQPHGATAETGTAKADGAIQLRGRWSLHGLIELVCET